MSLEHFYFNKLNENNEKIELLKLKKLHINNGEFKALLNTFNLPNQLEELTLQSSKLSIKSNKIEKITQLKKLFLKDMRITADCLKTLIKNNIYLEELLLSETIIFDKDFETEISPIELLQNNLQYLPSLRSITIIQKEFSDISIFISKLLASLNTIEEITLIRKKNYNDTIFYQKNHQILLKGSQISSLEIFNLFINHSNYVHFLKIDSELITADMVKERLHNNKDKLTQIKTLELPKFSDEEYLYQYPTLKKIELKNIALTNGSLQIKDVVDFQLLLNLIKHNNSDLTELVIEKIYEEVLNEELLLEYENNFSLKSLQISCDNVSSKARNKLINHSPYLESLGLSTNKHQDMDCDVLSKSLNELILKNQSHKTICNILKHRPLLRYLEIELPKENEFLLKLLKQCISESTHLKNLVLRGNLSLQTSQEILDLIIKKRYEMDTLILGEHFIFKKNEELTVRIPTSEDYLIDLFKGSPNLQTLQIDQSISIKKMFADRQLKNLNTLKAVSCLDSETSAKTLSETFDFLTSLCPQLGGYYSKGISVNFYKDKTFFIIDALDKKRRLQTTERLSNTQVSYYLNRLQIEVLDIAGIDGLLVPEEQTYFLSCNLNDTTSLLNNIEVFIKKSQFYNYSLKSPYLKIVKDKLEWHGDKLSDEEILKVLDLTKKFSINTLSIYHKLSLPVIKILKKEKFGEINFVEVNNQEELLVALMKERVDYTARNYHQQVLYKFRQNFNDLVCKGVRFPPSLLFLMLNSKWDDYFFNLTLEDFSFNPPLKPSPENYYNFQNLVLKNTNLKIDFIKNWLADTKYSYYRLNVINCPGIPTSQLKKLKNEYPALYIDKQQTEETLKPDSLPIRQEDLLDSIDAITGEQPWQDTDFKEKNNSEYFRVKKNQPSFPNYLRLNVQNDGPKNIRIVKNIPFNADVIKIYENNYEDHPDYYLGEPKLYLEKNTWQSLPSKTPEDKLIVYYAAEQLDWGYCDAENLFYVRCAKACKVKLSYLIHAELDIRFSNEEPVENFEAYFPCIKAINFETSKVDSLFQNQFSALQKMSLDFIEELLIAFCRFDVGDLSDSSLQGKKLSNLLIRERVGSCRHNVFAFNQLKNFFNQNRPANLKIEARASWSLIHIIIEIKKNNKWQMICLGGICMPEAVDSEEEILESQTKMQSRLKRIRPAKLVEVDSPQPKSSSNLDSQKESPRLAEGKLVESSPVLVPAMETSSNVPQLQKTESLRPNKDFSYVLSLNPFNRLKPPKFLAETDSELVKQLMNLAEDLRPGEKNILLNFESSAQIELFYAAMAAALTAKQKRFLLMHQPNQFNPVEFIIDEKTGEPTSQHTALVKNASLAKPQDFLIVNITNYNEKTVALLNALTERKNRLLANQQVSESLTIVAVKLNTTAVGKDVYSRFLEQEYFVPKRRQRNPFETFCTALNLDVSDENSIAIDFYDGTSWKSQLLGSLELVDQQVEYQKGALIEMIKSSRKSVRFYNPPMHIEEFRVTLLTLLNTREFDANGINFNLPEFFSYEAAARIYDLASPVYSYVLKKQSAQSEGSYVLNPTTYYHFFNNFQCNDGQFIPQKGWLLQHAQQELSLWVTGLLHESLWAKLLDTAKACQCQLVLSFESSLFMPPSMRKRMDWQEQLLDEPKLPQNYIVVSNDIHFAEIQCLAKDEIPTVVFAVNENTRFSESL